MTNFSPFTNDIPSIPRSSLLPTLSLPSSLFTIYINIPVNSIDNKRAKAI